jgi:hypothetical protein
MRSKIFFSILMVLAVLLAGCGFSPIQITANNPGLATALEAYTETAQKIIEPTNTPAPKRTPTRTLTISPTGTMTAAASLTPNETAATPSPSPTQVSAPKINALIMTCDTGIDIFNKLGEVTNAYVTVQNVGTGDANDVQIELSAVDEGKPHPDKSFMVQHLPFGYEISLKLSVDTTEKKATSLILNVTSAEGVKAAATKSSCTSLVPEEDIIKKMGSLFKVKKIATP